ncbi:MAG: plasmid pRiA4b ORF-3 family protein [Deltaproteobacteria bacterium]|nr:plasmid pRiA4b ORF-3 family protein [Deltaproteobacteria bacterium]
MGKIIRVDFPRKSVKSKKRPAEVFQLKIVLTGAKPPIWRRVQVPGNISLAKLHKVIQRCMGWTDSHMHHFIAGRNFYAPPAPEDISEGVRVLDEGKVKLCEIEEVDRKKFIYEYDFGDSWRHEIKVEKVIAAGETIVKHAVLLDGARACPPEDIGGIPGYEDFLVALENPEDEENGELLAEFGRDFDPDHLEVEAINKLLKKLR